MMSFQKLLFNFGLLFFANNFAHSEIIVLKAKNIPFQNFGLEHYLKKVAKNRDADGLKFFPEPEKVKNCLDLQNAWVNWAKKARVNVSIRHEAIENCLPRIINSASPIKHVVTTKYDTLRIKGIHFFEGRNENRVDLMITEPLHSWQKASIPQL
jgi:hypothetical protein|tara:strand:+ start:207 stop:668 length:462 start_codon:yes stop_codon:yes gene_type:complete